MVNVKSILMLDINRYIRFTRSSRIKYICGKCENSNLGRISIRAIRIGKPYMTCKHCNELNNTGLTLDLF